MKRIVLTLIVVLSLILPSQAQEKEQKVKTLEELEQKGGEPAVPDTLQLPEEEAAVIADEALPSEETSTVNVGDIVTVEEKGNETIVRIGKRGVRIIEEDGDTEIHIGESYDDSSEKPGRRSFKGHLGGVEFSFNGYMSDFWTTSLDPSESYMNLNTAKSTTFNIIFPNVSLAFTPHFGLVAAIGINWSDYHFDNNNNIATDDDGYVIPVYPPDGIRFEKTKLNTTYAVLPIILEGQIPVSGRRTINIGAGFIGAIKLGSNTKMVYYDPDKKKFENKDDFSLNLLRYGATARVGYEMFHVYGTAYFSPMFEKGLGPELYPFEVGIALTFNN